MAGSDTGFWGMRRLAKRLRWHLRSGPRVAFLLVAGVLAAVGVACQFSSNTFVVGVGQNLFADALLLVVAALVLDRLSKARERNDAARPFQVVYTELRDIYSKVFLLWMRWLVVACAARVDEMEAIPAYAFDRANEKKIEGIESLRIPEGSTAKALEVLAAHALAIQVAIDASYARIAPFGDLDALALLHSLRRSRFLAWSIEAPHSFANKGSLGIYGIGRNLLFRETEDVNLMRSLGALSDAGEGRRDDTANRIEWENAADIMRSLRSHLEELGYLVSPYKYVFAPNDQVTWRRLLSMANELDLSPQPQGDVDAWIARANNGAETPAVST